MRKQKPVVVFICKNCNFAWGGTVLRKWAPEYKEGKECPVCDHKEIIHRTLKIK